MGSPCVRATAPSRLLVLVLAIVATGSRGWTARAEQSPWKPVDKAELALAAPSIEPGADAEALVWDVRVADQIGLDRVYTEYDQYLRIKIFTDRGRETQSKVDVVEPPLVTVSAIEGRTTHADGTTIDLKPADIHERTLVKFGGLQLQAKSFVLPAVERGSVIEYRWKERRVASLAHDLRLPFQRDIPAKLITYHVKSLGLADVGLHMRAQPFHGAMTPPVNERDGYLMTSLANVPAFHSEPFAPPDGEVQPWLLVYYDAERSATELFKVFNRSVTEEASSLGKVNDAIRKAAAPAVAASTPDEKIDAILAVCHRIIRIDGTAAERAASTRTVENKTASDVLANGQGTAFDVMSLFLSLAAAAGMDAHLAAGGDRSQLFLKADAPQPLLMRSRFVAVRIGDSWRFVDPANEYDRRGGLRWQQESEAAAITADRGPISARTPLSGPDATVTRRIATFQLSDDGTLEGDIRVELTGHAGVEAKEVAADQSAADREAEVTHEIVERLPGAAVTAVVIENASSSDSPFVYTAHVRVPAYGERTGTRLFVQPAVMQKGLAPKFTAAARTNPVYFHYPWTEDDVITIRLPAGYELDDPAAPADLNLTSHAGYVASLGVGRDGSFFQFKRKLTFGAARQILFPRESYPALKQFFDELQKRDAHTLALKRRALQ
ncbi:MAG TPA: DUF3857 domain-containing protein [Vicinamibacterales bacterium]|nr:DUF3857 domain-containing protein [Vicinamibacterales bacterium]